MQYTSGSTGQPKGVMLSHANLVRNCELIGQGFDTIGDRFDSRAAAEAGFSWLPTYHDMGLVGGVLKPLWRGRPSVLMPPMAFLQKPIRWLRGITRFRSTISGGPNFAYGLCNDKITAAECEGLDLSCWEVAFNGAEPIRADTLERFTEKFAPYGFRAEAFYPCYGMAETTLIVTGGHRLTLPVVRAFETKALEQGRGVAPRSAEAAARQLVGCGQPLPGVTLKIVDPESRRPLPENQIGEIWIRGASVGLGYWSKPEEDACTFGAQLANGCHEPFLRTGDLGFINDGELFVTGRCKDVIIIHGRNLHPHDIELTVAESHPALRPDSGAAFSVDEDGEERLVIVQEVEREHRQVPADDIISSIRRSVWEDHQVAPHTVFLLRTGKLPKTSSGKVQRRACKEHFIAGKLHAIAQWNRPAAAEPHGIATAVVSTAASEPQAEGTSVPRSAAEIEAWLVEQIATRLKQPASEIEIHKPFSDFAVDSVLLIGLTGELEDWLGTSISPTLFFNFPTIAELAVELGCETRRDRRGGRREARGGRFVSRWPSSASAAGFPELTARRSSGNFSATASTRSATRRANAGTTTRISAAIHRPAEK